MQTEFFPLGVPEIPPVHSVFSSKRPQFFWWLSFFGSSAFFKRSKKSLIYRPWSSVCKFPGFSASRETGNFLSKIHFPGNFPGKIIPWICSFFQGFFFTYGTFSCFCTSISYLILPWADNVIMQNIDCFYSLWQIEEPMHNSSCLNMVPFLLLHEA